MISAVWPGVLHIQLHASIAQVCDFIKYNRIIFYLTKCLWMSHNCVLLRLRTAGYICLFIILPVLISSVGCFCHFFSLADS